MEYEYGDKDLAIFDILKEIEIAVAVIRRAVQYLYISFNLPFSENCCKENENGRQ